MSHNEYTLKEALEAMLKHYRLKNRYNETRIKLLWRELMGESIAKYTTDVKIHQRKLFVTVQSSPLRQELSMSRETIKKRLNGALGEEYLVDVVVR